MKITFVGKHFNIYGALEEAIEKKLQKLEKYFADDITVKVVLSKERDKDKIEVTINAGNAVFRTEQSSEDIYEAIDISVDKLARQISKFKGKLQKRYHENKSVRFEAIPSPEEDKLLETSIVKKKKLQLKPMVAEEAILEMEMIQHDFYIYLNGDSGEIEVAYKRKDGNYGILETFK